MKVYITLVIIAPCNIPSNIVSFSGIPRKGP